MGIKLLLSPHLSCASGTERAQLIKYLFDVVRVIKQCQHSQVPKDSTRSSLVIMKSTFVGLGTVSYLGKGVLGAIQGITSKE